MPIFRRGTRQLDAENRAAPEAEPPKAPAPAREPAPQPAHQPTRQPAPRPAPHPTPRPAPASPADRAFPTPHTAPGDGDPLLVELLAVVASGDWPTLRAALAPHADQEDLAVLLANLGAQAPAPEGWPPDALGAPGDDPLAHLVLGVRTFENAWRVRTADQARCAPSDRHDTFHGLLKQAEESLYRAAELDHGPSAPWYFLLVCGRGLDLGPEVTARRFEAVTRRSPGHVAAHRQMLQSLSGKWSGSHEKMHAFATAAMLGPHGDRLGELVPYAHLERWLDLGGKEAGCAYLQQDAVRAELVQAAELTISRPGYASPRTPYWASNLFAQVFSLAGLWTEALAAFKATDGVVTGRWGYINGKDPGAAYTQFRDVARHLG